LPATTLLQLPAVVAEYQTRLPDKKLLQAKLHEFYALAEAPAATDSPDTIRELDGPPRFDYAAMDLAAESPRMPVAPVGEDWDRALSEWQAADSDLAESICLDVAAALGD
jgi:hypothetical protein